MFARPHLWLLASLVAGATFAGTAAAAAPRVKDHAHRFSAAAVTEANEQLLAIQEDYRKDVVVETFNKVPFHRDPLRRVAKMNPAAREEFFRKWALGLVPGSQGVYVFIFDGPAGKDVRVQVGREVRRQGALTAADIQQIRDRVQTELDAGRPDEALREAVGLIHARLAEHLGGPVTPRPFDWLGTMMLVVGLAGAWLVLLTTQAARGNVDRPAFAGVSPLGQDLSLGRLADLYAALAEEKRARAATDAAYGEVQPGHADTEVHAHE